MFTATIFDEQGPVVFLKGPSLPDLLWGAQEYGVGVIDGIHMYLRRMT